MPLPLGCTAALRMALACLCVFVVFGSVAISAPDTTGRRPASILFTGHLNFDCVPDTVIGWPDASFHYLPYAIRWGKPALVVHYDNETGLSDTVLADSSCRGSIPLGRTVRETIIRYPQWRTLSGSVGFQRMNPDTLDDMVLYLWGSVNDSTGKRDTIRPLLVFGQQGLDTLAELDLGAIDAFQITPFFAMELRVGSELVEPELRDVSGVISYLLTPIAFEIHPDDTTREEEEAPGDSTQGPPIHIRIYPNPAGYEAQVEVDSLPPGEYYVEVVGVNGLVYLQQTVSVSMSGTLFGMLDLHAMLTGYYLVRVHDGVRVFALYPILITR